MTSNDNDMNQFKDLEATLKKAFAKEKMQGLAPHQLKALHEAVDQGSRATRKPRRRWWQWSVAGSLLATALVAIVVVDKFPGRQDVLTETPAPLADSRGALKDTPAESPSAQKAIDQAEAPRKREARTETEMDKPPKPAARPQAAAGDRPKSSANKVTGVVKKAPGPAKWESKSPVSSAKGTAQKAPPASLAESSAAKPSASSDGFGYSSGSAGSAAPTLGGAGTSSLNLTPGAPAAAAPEKARTKVAADTKKTQTTNSRIEVTALTLKGKGSAADLRKFVNARMADFQFCYASLRTRNARTKGDITVIWQFPVFKIRISADVFADTAMRSCLTEKISSWIYPSGMEGNAEMTLRFSH